MSRVRGIEICPLASVKGGMAEFYTPQSSHEATLVQVPGQTIGDLFVHKSQTDQILVVKDRLVFVVLVNRQYRYIPLSKVQQGIEKTSLTAEPYADGCIPNVPPK